MAEYQTLVSSPPHHGQNDAHSAEQELLPATVIPPAVGDGGGEPRRPMAPWEQHSAVINIPRYDYAAASALFFGRSYSGFLVTCPIKREKSATREAITIFEKFICNSSWCGSELLDPSKEEVATSKLKRCSKEESSEIGKTSDSVDKVEVLKLPDHETRKNTGRNSPLLLVKLSKSGLLLFLFPDGSSHRVVQILSNIFVALSSGMLKAPQWCNRIFPIQETCLLDDIELHAVVSRLFMEYWRDAGLDKPIKFAVGYNRRGIDDVEARSRNTTEDSKSASLIDRDCCFKVVAAAVKSVAKNSEVDLKSPEVAILVEVLPLCHGSSVVGISVLEAGLVTTKPRLCIKSMVADCKEKKNADGKEKKRKLEHA